MASFYIHVWTKSAVENDDADTGDARYVSVLGVDLGITNIATTSTGRFWGGGELNHWHREYEKHRGHSSRLGLNRHTRTSSESVGSKLGGLSRCFTRYRTSS